MLARVSDPRARLEHRPLGASGLRVSRLSLGSWRTFERLTHEQGVAIMKRVRAVGIDFLDDARYNDETGTAPLATGYSEVLFGELFRASSWPREEAVVSNKLWWEFWPAQDALAEIDASLERMGFEQLDLIYASTLPDSITPAEAVAQLASVLAAGRARAWGIVNWPGDAFLDAVAEAERIGLQPPCAAQLPYSLVRRDWGTEPRMTAALERSGAAIVASASLAGGVLSGKYSGPAGEGRMAAAVREGRQQPALAAARQLGVLAERLDCSCAALAFAFVLSRERVATALFGATSPEQIDADIGALELLARLSGAELAELEAIGDESKLPTGD
jgi:aryl-alcohol dehydrogenase-like predicted oxidoreductase